jgi:hypothetical protein
MVDTESRLSFMDGYVSRTLARDDYQYGEDVSGSAALRRLGLSATRSFYHPHTKSPLAMAAGVMDYVWELGELLAAI